MITFTPAAKEAAADAIREAARIEPYRTGFTLNDEDCHTRFARAALDAAAAVMNKKENECDRDNARLITCAPELVEHIRMQHDIIDTLLAMLIERDHKILPTRLPFWTTIAKTKDLLIKAIGEWP